MMLEFRESCNLGYRIAKDAVSEAVIHAKTGANYGAIVGSSYIITKQAVDIWREDLANSSLSFVGNTLTSTAQGAALGGLIFFTGAVAYGIFSKLKEIRQRREEYENLMAYVKTSYKHLQNNMHPLTPGQQKYLEEYAQQFIAGSYMRRGVWVPEEDQKLAKILNYTHEINDYLQNSY